MPRALKHALSLAAIVAFMLIAYSNSLYAPFVFDNDLAIRKDTRIRAVTSSNIHRIVTHAYWEENPNGLYRPFTTLSYLFNYAVLENATNPDGYHWLNLILHAVNMGLVYALGLAIFEQIPAALLLSAIWGLHPVQTESVTNIVGRADLLAAFSVLAVLLCYRKSLGSSGAWYAAWLAAIALVMTAGMFSKESAIVAVGVVALYDFTFERGISWRSRIPGYIAVTLPCLVFLYVRAGIMASGPYSEVLFADNPLVGAGFWTARMTAVKVIGRYFQLLVWPAQLSFDYSYNAIPLFGWRLSSWEDWKAVIAAIACCAAAVVAFRSWRRNKPLFFFIAFFFITLSPTSNLLILIGTIMGERFLYLPSVGFAACVVCAFDAVRRRLPMSQPMYRQAAAATVGVILIGFAFRIYDRNRDWLDQQRLWRSAVEAVPDSCKARIGATSNMLLVTQQDWDRSINDVARALAILDGLSDLQNVANPYVDAGVFYRALGDRLASKGISAESWYRKSLSVLLRAEKIQFAQDAVYRQENAKRGRPGLSAIPSSLYLELGRTYNRLSDPRRALEAFERGGLLEPDPDVLEELASAYRAAGNLRQAGISMIEALAVDPSRSQLTSKLVELYREIDPKGCSVSTQGLDLECPLVHGDLCTASRNVAGNFQRKGQQTEADGIRRTAVQELGCAAELVK